ncbi:sensor histidine kinase [Leadbettera azotonutricia ZAS-9]|uniref:histidine kinase n=2 Tax=Leadbettera azotonutricia TaxID=150829 RepID=F5YB84_LEAAZ|nr:sensor histidine kinase [Leadbettera azotonutricia ZAS-9]
MLTAHGTGQGPESEALDSFTSALDKFSASPAGNLYLINRPAITKSVTSIGKTAERLKAAAETSDENGVRSIMLEIDTAVDQLQIIDTGLSDTIQLRYFQLFFFFSLLVLLTVLVLWLLDRRLEKAISMGQQSLIFSRETVLAQEQERSRIARELHDTIAQDLWRLSFRADSINRAEQAEERRRICEEVVKGQQELMQRIRTICDTLVPPDFRRRGLPDAIRSLCYDFSRRTGIECAVTVQEGLNLEPLNVDMQLQCFRIVQECLANIEKHAEASEASVLVSNRGEGQAETPAMGLLHICVSDNGRGFDAPDSDTQFLLRAKGHFGLWNMNARAEALRGTLTIDSETGCGVRITLDLPLETEV